MGMIEAIKSCFSQYVTFSGRACRSEYWYWILFTILASVIIAVSAAEISPEIGFLSPLFFLGYFFAEYFRCGAPVARCE